MGIYDEHTPEIGSGKYFKPEDGKTYNLVIASEPAIFENVYEPQDGGEIQISTRYAWVIYNRTLKLGQILQLPPTGFKNLADIAKNPKWGEPTAGKYDIDYTKTGKGTDTKHSVIPVPSEGALTDEEIAETKAVDLLGSIEAGKGAQRVQWLKDYVSGKPAREPGTASPATAKKDVVIEDIGDEPINLDDIPF